jgi:4-alpha-glucanotransferase
VTSPSRDRVREALALLGVRRLLLGIHDAAFPGLPGEDVGRGAPASDGAAAFLDFAASLGFDGIQLGPQGATPPDDPSPYLGTLFSRNPLSIALAPLARAEGGALVSEATLAALVARRPPRADRVAHGHARRALHAALAEALATFHRRRAAGDEPLARRFVAFRAEHGAWLERDALYEVLSRAHGGEGQARWPAEDRLLFAPAPGDEDAAARRRRALLAANAGDVEAYAFAQFVAHLQHQALRARARSLALDLFGDLQIGMSDRDAWSALAFTMREWRMGAPPSRTNPEGQPWDYPVLDPDAYEEADASGRRRGAAVRFLAARARKVLSEYDGLRIDHPHGLVDPWVYRRGDDPAAAVRDGARLFSSPGQGGVPELARHAIARPDQLDPSQPRHADGWVRTLDPAQVARYAALLDVVMAAVRDAGRAREDVACEVLSTQPYPVGRVIQRHGLGRFRVTQKADLDRADDVYRGENARREDWIMMGNHDTPPIRLVAERWIERGIALRRAEYLASRLLAPGEPRDPWVRAIAADAGALAQAQFADLFVGPAANVMVFFADLLGAKEPYNVPGTQSHENWSARVPPDFRQQYAARLAEGRALDLPRALARALRSRGAAFAGEHEDLLAALDLGA